MASKGRRYELTTCKDLNGFQDEIIGYPAGYSGNQYGPSPDIVLNTPSGSHALELKKINLNVGQRRTVIKGNEFDTLEDCENSYTTSWIIISISNRKTLVCRACPVEDIIERIPDAFEASLTDNRNLRLVKPETSEWPSKRKQDINDAELILKTISNYVSSK